MYRECGGVAPAEHDATRTDVELPTCSARRHVSIPPRERVTPNAAAAMVLADLTLTAALDPAEFYRRAAGGGIDVGTGCVGRTSTPFAAVSILFVLNGFFCTRSQVESTGVGTSRASMRRRHCRDASHRAGPFSPHCIFARQRHAIAVADASRRGAPSRSPRRARGGVDTAIARTKNTNTIAHAPTNLNFNLNLNLDYVRLLLLLLVFLLGCASVVVDQSCGVGFRWG